MTSKGGKKRKRSEKSDSSTTTTAVVEETKQWPTTRALNKRYLTLLQRIFHPTKPTPKPAEDAKVTTTGDEESKTPSLSSSSSLGRKAKRRKKNADEDAAKAKNTKKNKDKRKKRKKRKKKQKTKNQILWRNMQYAKYLELQVSCLTDPKFAAAAATSPGEKKSTLDALDETAESWTKEQEENFFRALIVHGMPVDEEGEYDWMTVKILAQLHDKTDEMIGNHYLDFLHRCRKGVSAKKWGNQIDDDTFRLYVKALQRVILFNDLRIQIFGVSRTKTEECLAQGLLPECPKKSKASKMPDWWIAGPHDKALLEGIDMYGFGMWEDICSDPSLPFYAIAQEKKKAMSSAEKDGDEDSSDEDDSHKEWKEGLVKNALTGNFPEEAHMLYLFNPNREGRGRNTRALDFPHDLVCAARIDYVVKYLKKHNSKKKKKKTAKRRKRSDSNGGGSSGPKKKKAKASNGKKGKNAARSFYAVSLDEDGNVSFPIKIGDVLFVHSLGEVDPSKPLFHAKRYIWPNGFKSTRTYASTLDPTKKCMYTSVIRVAADGKSPGVCGDS
eukprot:TRINITY_DN521_c0_g2_i1.p1 TRINITY_DN521_c0_g2~~TRINITY_DN521_c0_g2_i1.p1  ORF type:complete len:646 (+),score=188.49 TRINITY_DN521_c0_g2_i1:274-1938(+)